LVKIILAILFLILLATFSSLNREEVVLRYLFGWSAGPFPFFLLVLASLVVGMIIGFSMGWGERWKLRAQARELRKRAHALRDEIEALTAKREPPEPPPELPEASKTTDP